MAFVHLGAAPELLSPEDASALKGKLPGMLLMRSIPVVGEDSIAIARSYEGLPISYSWTAIESPTAKSARSA